jgi:hypothetical protein
MRDTRTPRDDEQRRGRSSDDESREATWYEEAARRPVDDPVIATIPLPDDQ